jgi:hypothetical protein
MCVPSMAPIASTKNGKNFGFFVISGGGGLSTSGRRTYVVYIGGEENAKRTRLKYLKEHKLDTRTATIYVL